jgi:N-acetylglutamate synthase-like GNAT family acetyltransferase
MAKVDIRPATAEDLESFYGSSPKRSMRAFVGVMDGKPVGLAGIYYWGNQVVAFSEVKPEMPRHAIGRGALKVLSMIRRMGVPVLALAQGDIPGAPEFLKRCGFEHVDTTCQGEVYRWHNQ